MKWLRTILIDVLVTVMIAMATIGDVTWARWAVGIYTVLMVVLKLAALSGSWVQQRLKGAEQAPVWVFHLLYGLNFALCLFDRWWWVAAGWAVIWVLSFQAYRKTGKG